MVNILIVDEHLFMRHIIRDILEKENDLEVIGEASNGQEAEWQASQVQPDVVLMNINMPDCDGLDVIERVIGCSPGSRIVIFTSDFHVQHIVPAIQKGAIGYISKDIEPDALVHAIRCAARNNLCIPGALATEMLTYLRPYWQSRALYTDMFAPIPYRTPRRASAKNQGTSQAPPNIPRSLTEREREILDLIRCGRKNREIAGELCIAESTVHKHVQNIFEKLHARNRTEAIYLMSIRHLH